MHRHPPSGLRRAREMRRERTDAEHWLWQHLRGRRLLGWKFRRQVPLGNYIVDFICKDSPADSASGFRTHPSRLFGVLLVQLFELQHRQRR